MTLRWVVFAALGACATWLPAQEPQDALQVSAGLGAFIPLGIQRDREQTGYALSASMDVRVPAIIPLAVRFEAMYATASGRAPTIPASRNGAPAECQRSGARGCASDTNIGGLGANLVVSPWPGGWASHVYELAGAGAYHVHALRFVGQTGAQELIPVWTFDSDMALETNVGAGVQASIHGVPLFAEGEYRAVSRDDMHCATISIGFSR